MNNTKIKDLIKTNKWGLTTGACAAAAAKAAAIKLYHDEAVDSVEISLPAGVEIMLPVIHLKSKEVKCFVQKPQNSDPDVTKDLKIYATVKKSENEIIINGGKGIGMVTKPGLSVDVGEPAINRTPLKMIKEEVKKVIPRSSGIEVTISAPQGIKLASKTFNERLGITGGISILGTTGLVKPMSKEAYKISLASEIDVAKAAGFDHLIITPGNIGRKAALKQGFESDSIVMCSNYIGFALKHCQIRGLKKVTIIGHLGKLLKILDGAFNTHSQKHPLNFEQLRDFLNDKQINRLNTAEEAIALLKEKDQSSLDQIAYLINEKSSSCIKNKLELSTLVIDINGEVVGRHCG